MRLVNNELYTKMKQQVAFKKLQRIIAADIPFIKKNFIFDIGNDYDAFGDYYISKTDIGYTVHKQTVLIGDFTTTRTALSWCIADKQKQHTLADNILVLDARNRELTHDLHVRSQLIKSIKSAEKRDFLQIKIIHRKDRLKQVEDQLDKCVGLAKYWQQQGFNNETARTGRPSSIRTSR